MSLLPFRVSRASLEQTSGDALSPNRTLCLSRTGQTGPGLTPRMRGEGFPLRLPMMEIITASHLAAPPLAAASFRKRTANLQSPAIASATIRDSRRVGGQRQTPIAVFPVSSFPQRVNPSSTSTFYYSTVPTNLQHRGEVNRTHLQKMSSTTGTPRRGNEIGDRRHPGG